ncbi:MAG: glucose-6-phosphate isomerase [Parachlamydiales bacterium]|nr:glucose-6-phosphate isomerase [Parachlamydiales bacterium]
MPMFYQYPSVQKLYQLSKNPIDLTDPQYLTVERIQEFLIQTEEILYFYGMQRVTSEVLDLLYRLAKESLCVEKMKAMQNGEIVNSIVGFASEHRQVLHTASRDFFDHANESLEAKKAAKTALEEVEKLQMFCAQIDRDDRWTDIVQIGIGGSDLGPRAIATALEAYYKKNRRIHFISNVDPDDVAGLLKQLDLSTTLFISVSKSGTTLETLTNEYFVKEALKAARLHPKNHMISVTGKGSPMDDPSQYLASFYIWDYIGGRYSCTSMVGGVVLALAMGFDRFIEFLRGAHQMDVMAKIKDPSKNLPLHGALLGIWNRNFLSYPTVAIIPYAQVLHRFSAHLQQLDMESNGKQIDQQGKHVSYQTGPVIWGEPGTNGQHSFYQFLHQGTDIVPVEFIGFVQSTYEKDLSFEKSTSQEKLLSNLLAQSIALAQGYFDKNPNKNFPGNRPNSLMFFSKLTPKTMGMLLSYYEHKIAFQGFIWGINSFDQEGVQLGKRIAEKMLHLFQGIAEDFPLGAAFLEKIFTLKK